VLDQLEDGGVNSPTGGVISHTGGVNPPTGDVKSHTEDVNSPTGGVNSPTEDGTLEIVVGALLYAAGQGE
jgi:hypothetical protein